MRYPTSVTLDSVVLHSLDARADGPGFRPSKALLPFGSDRDLTSYLTTHIRQSLNHTAAKAAKFSDQGEVEAFQLCDAMHEDRLSLLEGSTRLAERLFEIMVRDGRIKPGVVAFCFYRDSEAATDERRLALLKIDLGKVFRTKTLVDDAGNEIISLEVDRDALTTTRERLHKSAFVRKLAPRAPDYDLILLDRQSRPGRDEEGELVPTIAKFFIEDFLGAEEALDPKERTRKFHKAVMAAVNTLKHRGHIDIAQEGTIVRAMETALNAASVNVEAWADALPLPQEHRDILWDIVVREQPDMEFAPEAQYVRQALRKARYIGSSGLTVTVNAAQAESVVIDERLEEDGLQKYWIITLRTERWDKTS
jgi:nucleoid-associated protein YejK